MSLSAGVFDGTSPLTNRLSLVNPMTTPFVAAGVGYVLIPSESSVPPLFSQPRITLVSDERLWSAAQPSPVALCRSGTCTHVSKDIPDLL